MKKTTGMILSVIVLFSAMVAYGQSKLTASDAKNHVGETATVCGQVASTHFAAQSHRSPTFLNIDAPYPRQIFTALIWGSDRPKFGNPERTYANRRVCVSGRIDIYKGVPEIIVSDPNQIEIQK